MMDTLPRFTCAPNLNIYTPIRANDGAKHKRQDVALTHG